MCPFTAFTGHTPWAGKRLIDIESAGAVGGAVLVERAAGGAAVEGHSVGVGVELAAADGAFEHGAVPSVNDFDGGVVVVGACALIGHKVVKRCTDDEYPVVAADDIFVAAHVVEAVIEGGIGVKGTGCGAYRCVTAVLVFAGCKHHEAEERDCELGAM